VIRYVIIRKKFEIMQQPALPIKLNELFKLTNVGLNPDLFKFGNLTLESEKYVCVKDGSVSFHLQSFLALTYVCHFRTV